MAVISDNETKISSPLNLYVQWSKKIFILNTRINSNAHNVSVSEIYDTDSDIHAIDIPLVPLLDFDVSHCGSNGVNTFRLAIEILINYFPFWLRKAYYVNDFIHVLIIQDIDSDFCLIFSIKSLVVDIY